MTSALAVRATPYVCTLSDDVLQKAVAELFEVPGRRQDDIAHLRTWLARQPHLRSRDDDRFLLMFLRGGKFSLERAKEKLELFHTLKTHCPEVMGGGDPLAPDVQRALRSGAFVPMPKPLPNGQRLVILRVARRDTERTSQETMFRVSNMISALLTERDEAVQVCGFVILVDLEGASLAHATAMTPLLVKKAATCWDATPVRQKGVHYVNCPAGMQPVLNLIRMCVSDKLRRRIHVHGQDRASLHAAVPPECLPEEYGGLLGRIDDLADAAVRDVERNRDFFIDHMRYGVDEAKRSGKPKTAADLFGIEGSFRKLEID